MCYHLAIDIGASSGRHMLGRIDDGKIVLEEIYRFNNIQISRNGHDCWDMEMLFSNIVEGIKQCKVLNKIPDTIAIDTWGVDYVLLDENGSLVCDAVAYRDKRTQGIKEKLDEILPFEKIYERTGIQYQPYNTIYQLYAQKLENPDEIARAKHFLMIPEYFNYRLTGKIMNDYTNATTTSLINAESKQWDTKIIDSLGVSKGMFGKLHMPPRTVGKLTDEIADIVGFNSNILLCASHDTASAFIAVPAKNDTSVYISSGTWSLLGVENEKPFTDSNSRNANFTNEGGYEYRFRYLKNIMGLWMIQSIRREINGISYVNGKDNRQITTNNVSYADLEHEARKYSDFVSIIDVDREEFLSPNSMIQAIKDECKRTNQQIPQTTGQIMQCVYKSLAQRYAEAIKQLQSLTGKKYTHINIVGGGSKDTYLNELTEKATGLEVIAGPTEGTALGNLVLQFMSCSEFETLSQARKAIRESFNI